MYNYYATENIFLASYIKAHDLEVREVRSTGKKSKNGNMICEFVFLIDKDDPKIKFLEAEYEDSDRGKLAKSVLFASKKMKGLLHDYMTSSDRLEEEAREVLEDAIE